MDLYRSVLLLGGRGMLARAMLRELRRRGHEAAPLDLPELDVTDAAALAAAMQRHSPTLVINCAAHTRVDACEQEEAQANAVNGRAVGSLAELCRQRGARLVHYSTDFVFDGTARRPYREDDPTNPLSAYGRSKLLGEILAQQRGGDRLLLIRTAWLYGPGGASFPRTMVDLARAGKPLRIVSDQVGSPTYTRDLAAATLDLLDHDAAGLYHAANDGQVSWFDFAAAILDEFGLRDTTELTPITAEQWKSMRPASAIRPAYSVLDTSALVKLLGKPRRPWRDALRDYHQAVEADGF